ncbi:transglycosylase SLT domain-containing protein [Zavarzinia sp.]|uniref:transglycosylase SLT domain-containing protein n=1 Tax=Zavarzinia sp. TaxID=2027920 RepID=UPI003568845E
MGRRLALAALLATLGALPAPAETSHARLADAYTHLRLKTATLEDAQVMLDAAQAGDPRAAEAIAWMLGTGTVLDQNPPLAFEWYLRAYLQGLPDGLKIAYNYYLAMNAVERAQLDPAVLAYVVREATKPPPAEAPAAPKPLTAPPPTSAEVAEVLKILQEETRTSNVSYALARAVAKVESGFRSNALSPAGARGIMQIMPATARGELGLDPDTLWDARVNIRAGVRYLGSLIDRYGSVDIALSHYNGGSAVGPPGRAKVIPATQPYVDAVKAWMAFYLRQEAGPQPAAPRQEIFVVPR